ncbi:MAG: HAD family phosphatase [Clostridia bacterium]|nr:HAD family phosphatase [Clostridia bacterium]
MLQNPVQLIAMDMDGTLLPGQPALMSPVNQAVLLRAVHAGISLVFASGRLVDDAAFFALDAGLDPAIIGLNGAATVMHPFGDLQETHHIDPAVAHRILRVLIPTPLTFGLFCDHDLIVRQSPGDTDVSDLTWGTYMQRKGTRTHIYREQETLFRLSKRGASKFVILDRHESGTLPEIRCQLLTLCPDLSISSSWHDNIEVNAPGVDKGSALCSLAKRMHIPMEHVMAIGDNANDVPMLERAGISVAMGNATEDALASARYVTRTNTEDGVAAAILTLALNDAQEGVHPTERSGR